MPTAKIWLIPLCSCGERHIYGGADRCCVCRAANSEGHKAKPCDCGRHQIYKGADKCSWCRGEEERAERLAVRCKRNGNLICVNEETDPDCPYRRHSNGEPTSIECFLRDVILGEFPEVICEKYFAPYWVDAYLPPPYHLAFEADGEYWHEGSEKEDAERDAFLLREFNLPVVRFSEFEIRMLEETRRGI